MTSIEWTDESPNPLHVKGGGHHCVKASLGCENCYAEKMNLNPWFHGNGQPYRVQADTPEMELDTKMLASWARKRKPKKHFVCSMTDMFGEWVPNNYIFQILDAMANSPLQTFQVLTKRVQRGCHLINQWCDSQGIGSLPANIWFGVSAENQEWLDKRLIWLIHSQVQVQFLSLEPLLGPIFLPEPIDYIDQVIIGGESGPNARPIELRWVESLLEQCKESQVAAFVKQMGTCWAKTTMSKHKKGGNPAEWLPKFRIRMFPSDRWKNG